LVRRASAGGVPVSVDPNLRPSITPDLDLARSFVADLLPLAAVVKLSDEDAEVLWPARDTDAVLAALSAAPNAPLVAITRGGDGAVLTAGGLRARAAAPPVQVADTIGAGDSFMAALLAGLLTSGLLGAPGWTEPALGWLGALAVEAAAVTCSRPGADPPWAGELPALAAAPGPARRADLPAGNLGA
jgi:fructokinase